MWHTWLLTYGTSVAQHYAQIRARYFAIAVNISVRNADIGLRDVQTDVHTRHCPAQTLICRECDVIKAWSYILQVVLVIIIEKDPLRSHQTAVLNQLDSNGRQGLVADEIFESH